MEDNREITQEHEEQQESQEEQEERTYSQQEVDDIIRKRLARERRKYEREFTGNEADREKALNARELKITAREKLVHAGMPSSLADVLKYEDEKTLEEAIAAITAYKKEPSKAWGERMGFHSSKPDRIRQAMGLDRKG